MMSTTNASTYTDVAATAATTSPIISAVRRPGRSIAASAQYHASGSPHACVAAGCASRVSVCTLNAASAPATIAARIDPVHRHATHHALHPVSARPAIVSRLNASTGEPPSHRTGATSSAGAMSGSE